MKMSLLCLGESVEEADLTSLASRGLLFLIVLGVLPRNFPGVLRTSARSLRHIRIIILADHNSSLTFDP